MMTIRLATEEDAVEIRSLMFESVGSYPHEDFNPAGWDFFVSVNSVDNVLQRLRDKEYLTLCYCENKRMVGYIVVWQAEKLDQLFVLPSAQNRGIATKLWLAIKNQYCQQTKRFWLRASSQAVPVYEKFGFKFDGQRQQRNGIFFYPMVLEDSGPMENN